MKKDIKNMSKSDLLKIGNNVASIWGGSCHDVWWDSKNEEYVFECTEHGEAFVSTLKEDELKEYMY